MSASPPEQLPSPWPMQGPFHAMPKAVRSVEVEGTSKAHTVSWTGTSWDTPPVTGSVPLDLPAAGALRGAGVLARRGALRRVRVDQPPAAVVGRHVEGERVALLARDRIDV